MNGDLKKIVKQNEIIISLLGRMVFSPAKVTDIVTSNKRSDLKLGYINGYNALDGNKSVSEIASIIGATPPTLSPILSEWEEVGIIFEVQKPRGKFYKKLFPIEEAV